MQQAGEANIAHPPPPALDSGMIRTALLVAMATTGRAMKPTFVGDAQRMLSQSSLFLRETCREIATSISTASEVYDVGSLSSISLVF